MTYKNVTSIAMFSVVALVALTYAGSSTAYAEDSGYKMVDDITPVLTFTYRDGVETISFPVFEMGENFVSNSGTTFSVEGTVGKHPLLHKALDEAYKNRLGSGNGYEYPFKYFDVDVNFVKNGESIFALDYNNCKVDNYKVETLDSNDYESYFQEVGFAIVDNIDFECSGVNYNQNVKPLTTTTSFVDYGESGFKFANGMRTSLTLFFNEGTEKIEFPSFTLTSGFEESSDNVVAQFDVEGMLEYYPLLYKAIDNSRRVSGTHLSSNTDFDVLAEFTNGDEVYRGINFRDCRVSDAEVTTQTDKEEGFTGKSGFAIVHQVGFTCSGLQPINPNFDELSKNISVLSNTHLSHVYDEPLQNTEKDLSAMVTFTTDYGVETAEFSMFTQSNVLTATVDSGSTQVNDKAAYPTFELRGIVGDYPILYKIVDSNRKLQSVSGTQSRNLVDVDVDLVQGDEVLRGFNYQNCRPTDHSVDTNPNHEESYTKNKFALENIFEFECQGYHANNPVYDAMYNTYAKAKTLTTNDLRNTDQWGPGFYVP